MALARAEAVTAPARDVATDRLRFHLANPGALPRRAAGSPTTALAAVTTDLAWALTAMHGRLSGWKTHLVLLDAARLPGGALHRYNDLGRRVADPFAAAKRHEWLVWGPVPPAAVVHEWSHARVDASGLTQVLPALRALRSPTGGKSLPAFREGMRRGREAFTAEAAEAMARALVRGLKMDPRAVWVRQLFLFLLGLAWGIEVQDEMDAVEVELGCDEESRRLVVRFEEALARLQAEQEAECGDDAGDELTRVMQKLSVAK